MSGWGSGTAKHRRKDTGFTIVELLIVVVVIAILAAVSIVAYNGITNRAKNSAAVSATQQAGKKIASFAITNNDTYPNTLDEAEIRDTPTTSYQYKVDNTTSPKTFCITATSQNVSYYVSSTSSAPTLGACAGHGVNGVPPITNWVLNPSFETNVASNSRSGAGTAPITTTRSTVRSHQGAASLLQDVTGSGQTGLAMQTPSSGERLRVNAGESAYWSLWVYSTKAGVVTPYCDGSLVAGGYAGLSGAPAVTIPQNTWTKVVGYGTRSVGSGDMYITQCGAYNLPVVAGDQLWYDEFIITKDITPREYADGNTANWAWTGAVNNSPSVGPPF